MSFLLSLVTTIALASGLSERVLIVENSAYPESVRVANYYARKRDVPLENRCAISVEETVQVSLGEYEREIKEPVKTCLERVGTSKILYVVFSYLTPFKVVDDAFNTFSVRSVDSLITDILDELSPSPLVSAANKYQVEARTQEIFYPPFVSFEDYRKNGPTIYSVWRLDGPSEKIARRLISKAVLAERLGVSGIGYFDRRFGNIANLPDSGYFRGDWDLFWAARFTENIQIPIIEDDNEAEFGTAPAPLSCPNALFYSGWYSYGHYNDVFSWATGAIGFHLDSGSALDPRHDNNWAGGAIAKGITVTSGAVAEPYLHGLPHPDCVFKYISEGSNVGDAFFRSTHDLKWMVQNIGDPLYRPFMTELKSGTRM